MTFNLGAALAAAIDENTDSHSGNISSNGRERAENSTLEAMCAALGVSPEHIATWSESAEVQAWLDDNSKSYIEFCLEQAGVVNASELRIEAAGVLRAAGKI